MPAWWPKKSSKIKEETQQSRSQSPHGSRTDFANNGKERAKSFEDVIVSRNSPRASSGFLGFESDSIEKKGHPLPRPSVSDHGGAGFGSGSESSVSSTGSLSEDHNIMIAADQAQLGGYRGSGEIRVNLRPKSPCARAATCPTPTSPLHQRLSGMSLESLSQSQCHRLPLPPGSPSYPPGSPSFPPGSPTLPPSSPTRPPGSPTLPLGSPTFPPGSPTSPSSVLHSSRIGVTENIPPTSSKVKKGRLLGRGTFGHVYLGFNSENGQMCAIKEVKVFSDDQSCRERMKQLNQEINLLSQLSHPNIVRYYGSELSEESLSVFLEYVSGGSIHKLLQEYGPFGEPVIQTYTRQILCGLAYLHGRNTVHRDIKGANILVDPNGEIKLADFGMAKHITAATSMLSFKGSPYWMAPEVVMNTNGYSLAVDIWSLGCTVLEMATARPPWSQYEGVAAIFKIGNSKDIPEIPSHLSGDMKSFVRLCLQREPSARPTAAQLLDHPFVRDQASTRVSNNNVMRDTFPYGFDGTRTPPVLELHSQRHGVSSSDVDYVARSPVTVSRTPRSLSPRDSKTITSLPVSPTASPLRQYGGAQRSCFLSPPHPAYALVGQSNYNLTDFSSPSRPNSRYTHDPISILLRSQTPGGGRTL